MKKIIEIIKNKWLKNTIITAILIILFIIIYIGLSQWLERANIEDIDVTTNKLYTLMPETKEKIKNIKETKIVLLGMEEEEKVQKYVELYAKANSKITYEEIKNIVERPDLVSKYALDSTSMAIIVETDKESKILIPSDLYTYDYLTYERIENIEQAITNAITDVNLETKPKVYFMENHLKYEDSSKVITEYLKNEAKEVEKLDILTEEKIPEDCNVLVITTLKEDITESEKQKIMEYIKNGGKMLIFSDPNPENIELNNYNQILEMYGVSVSKGYIYEQNTDRMVNNLSSIIIPDISYSSDITKYISTDGTIVFINSGKLNFKTDEELENLGVEVENLITSSETAFYREDLTQDTNKKTEKDEEAAGASLGVHIIKTIKNEETNGQLINQENNQEENKENKQNNENIKKSELIIFANSLFASDMPIQLSSQNYEYGIYFYNNKDLVLNSISKLTQEENTITIRKDTGLITYIPTAEQDTIIKNIIIALPIIIILTGIIIWLIRKRK